MRINQWDNIAMAHIQRNSVRKRDMNSLAFFYDFDFLRTEF